MKMHMNNKRQDGFSILEVMIGIFIFVVGLLALSALQGALTRAMADAKVRTTAANIAERTIEGHRGFTEIVSDIAVPATFRAYNDIVSSPDPAPTETVNGITYTVTTNVTDHYYDLATDAFVTTPPTGALNSTYKQVEVTVSWGGDLGVRAVDVDGNPITTADLGSGEIVLTASIPALVTSASARIADESTGDPGTPPITYQPGQNPDIISLSLGDNKFKESLLPEPEVTVVDELVETRFDVITYSQTDSGSSFLRREEFAAVSCECLLKAPSDDELGHRPVIWAGDEYVRGQHAAGKRYGVSNNNQQSWLCDTCCMDHHDGGTSADLAVPDHADTAVNVYDPFRPSTEYNESGDHRHYNPDKKTGILTEAATDQPYIESCRLVRVDGFFRVAQDFRREDLNIFPADFMDTPNEIDVYSDFVTGAAATFADQTYPDYELDPPCIGPWPCQVAPAPMQGDYDDPITPDADGNPTEFPSWTTLPLYVGVSEQETQQLRSRGVYIDYLSYDLRTALASCTGDDPDPDDCKSGDVILDRTGSTNPLEMIPFFDVQMTRLNRWNETPVPIIPVDASNDRMVDNNAYSRGEISDHSVEGGATVSTVVAEGHRGNIGFTDTYPVDPQYASDVTSASLKVHVGEDVVEPTPEGVTIAGNLSETLPGDPTIVITGLHGVLCGQTSPTYSCIVPTGAVNPQIELSGYGKKGKNHYACSIDSVLNLNTMVTENETARAVYDLDGEPEGTTYNFVIGDEPC